MEKGGSYSSLRQGTGTHRRRRSSYAALSLSRHLLLRCGARAAGEIGLKVGVGVEQVNKLDRLLEGPLEVLDGRGTGLCRA